MMGEITILKKAVAAGLQDQGRVHFAEHGVPRSGSVDLNSAQKINSILGNEKYNTVLEWALMGPTLQFSKATYICLSHASTSTKLNGNKIRAREKIYVSTNSTLQLGAGSQILYQYLAIKGGFKSKQLLGSQSTLIDYNDLYQGRLEYEAIPEKQFNILRPIFDIPTIKSDQLVRVITALPGPEFDLLPQTAMQDLEQYFTLSQNRNRMGIHIKEQLTNSLPNMLSAPTIPGTIQLTSGGTMIILGRDCQTTGGYPRILWLPEASLAELYQLQSGVKFRFDIVE